MIDRKRKDIIKLFKEHGLSITIETNIKIVNYLDIQMNLNDNTYKPFRKANNLPLYIHKESKHPSSIIKKLPESISKRVSEISSNEAVFNNAKNIYNTALKSSGFNETLSYTPSTENNREKSHNRKRKIIWYNPPFSKNVKTNIGKMFFKLIKKHFPKENPLSKIFNKNTLKLSYSCMKNMSSIISSHNKTILEPNVDETGCNCKHKLECPVENKCLTKKVIYKAEVKNNKNEDTKIYIGLSENSFKERYRNHTKSFRHDKYKNETVLSKYIWDLKENDAMPIVKWSFIKTIKGKLNSNNCSLCLIEKFNIINLLDDKNLLNKKSEFISKCRHVNKFMIGSIRNDSMD